MNTAIIRILTLLTIFVVVGCGAPDTTPDNHNNTTVSWEPREQEEHPTPPEPPEVVPTELDFTISTFNLYRMFDDVCDGINPCDDTSYEPAVDVSEFIGRNTTIFQGLTRLESDIYFLQEVENENVLNHISHNFPDHQAVMVETGYATTLDTAYLIHKSFKITHQQVHRKDNPYLVYGVRTHIARELMEVHLEKDGQTIILFNVHLLSKANRNFEKRHGEAQDLLVKLVAQAAEDNPDALIIVGGDFNETPDNLEIPGVPLLNEPDYTYQYNSESLLLDNFYVSTAHSLEHTTTTLVEGNTEDMFGFHGSDHAAVKSTITHKIQ